MGKVVVQREDVNEDTPASPAASPYWHPFSAMGSVGERFTVVRAEDVWIYDSQGRRYLDATASLWCVNAGHARSEIIDAISAQMRELDTYQTFGDFSNLPAEALARRLAELAPVPGARVLLGSGGGDGIETAAKLARAHFAETGRPKRALLISREHGYHGTHGFGTSLAGMPSNRVAGPWHPGTLRVPYDDPSALEAAIVEADPDRVAAFFVEPVIGAGGVLLPPAGYIEAVAEICGRHGVLLIADAVICGFGRLGSWFGIERFGVTPDMIVFAKGVTSGYLPLGGVIVHERVAAPFWDVPDAPPFRHGVTYAGHPAACAAALANIEVIERDGLLARAEALERQLADALGAFADHPLVTEVRSGIGVLGAIELDPGRVRRDAAFARRAFEAIRRHGAIVRPLASALAFSPPLTATAAHLDLLVDAVGKGLDELT